MMIRKSKQMMKITSKEWRELPEGYKGYVHGKPYMLMLKHGVTVYAPVKLVKVI